MAVFIDALYNALYFPITPFALLLLLEGLATLAVAWTGMGEQRTLRYVKGLAFCCAAALILAGHHHGNFILSMIFGTLFLADGLLQISAKVVRYCTCSSSVSHALEAAIEGASARVWGSLGGWRPFLRVITTPELWVAAQLRKRAATMAWTPGLTLDYARALSMLADPQPSGWVKMARFAVRKMVRSRQQWRAEERDAAGSHEAG